MQEELGRDAILRLIEVYDRTITSLKESLEKSRHEIELLRARIRELENIINMERVKATAEERRIETLDSEIKGLLKGKSDATKQAVHLILSMDEQFGTIRNAAKYLRRSAIPWTAIGLAVVMAAILGPLAWVLSNPQNLQLIINWISVPMNQLFVGLVVVSSVGVAAAILFAKRRGKA